MNKECKRCSGGKVVKNGIVRNKQRYVCRDCGYNFVVGDERVRATPEKIALAVLFCGHGKSSMRFMGKVCSVSGQTIANWLKKVADMIEPERVSSDIVELKMDEMWARAAQAFWHLPCRRIFLEKNTMKI